MNMIFDNIIIGIEIFFVAYLLIYSSYLFLAVVTGAWNLYRSNRMTMLHNELKLKYYMPVSIIVPAYNEEITIRESIKSMLNLDYQLYEIIVVDDGSEDRTAEKLIKTFDLKALNRPIPLVLKCKPYNEVYETFIGDIKLTLIKKLNGGKGDALNMGINASRFPYFLSVDADSVLQKDSLEKIVQPVIKDDNTIAVGGIINIAQGVTIKDGTVTKYHLPWNPIISMQILEYFRSFLASRILLNKFNGNFIVSGAFGLFKKSIVIEAGGYATDTLGEDMEIVLRLHVFCRNNNRDYAIQYEPKAVCWSQAPTTLKDVITQRRRWFLGLFQCMTRYRFVFINKRYGLLSFFSYMYYLFFELLSPAIEVLGISMILLSLSLGVLDIEFMTKFFLLYSIYGMFLTITAYYQRIYIQNKKISIVDTIKVILMSFLEGIFLRYLLSFVRVTSLIGYKNKRMHWGSIKRLKKAE